MCLPRTRPDRSCACPEPASMTFCKLSAKAITAGKPTRISGNGNAETTWRRLGLSLMSCDAFPRQPVSNNRGPHPCARAQPVDLIVRLYGTGDHRGPRSCFDRAPDLDVNSTSYYSRPFGDAIVQLKACVALGQRAEEEADRAAIAAGGGVEVVLVADQDGDAAFSLQRAPVP